MLQKRKLITTEVEYGPQREDARISCSEGGPRILGSDGPLGMASTGQARPEFPQSGKAGRGSQRLRRASLGASGSLKFTFHSDAAAVLSECFCKTLPTVIPWCLPLSFLCCPPSLCSQVTVTVSGGDQVGRGRGLSQGWGLRPVGNLEICNITSF